MPLQDSPEPLGELVNRIPFWWHSIDLGDGVVTPGGKSPQVLAQELANYQLTDLHGRSVLDIGAWDGYFSFAAERLGAASVTALDHFVWSMDFSQSKEKLLGLGYTEEQLRRVEEIPEWWRPHELPGKRGFDLVHRARDSRVQSVVGDFMTMDLSSLGSFDIVLYLGVLYHIRHPLLALERVAQVTKQYAVIETEAVYYAPMEDHAWCEFFETDELNGDPSNWWVPNLKALVGMCRAAGFSRVEVLLGPKKESLLASSLRQMEKKVTGKEPMQRCRLAVRAWK